MSSFLEKLLSISSEHISSCGVDRLTVDWPNYPLVNELLILLGKKNGFYAFESALHIFPFETTGEHIGIVDWNKTNLWIDSYDDLARDAVFFAEDIFGGQFCIRATGVYSFDPETGSFEYLEKDIEGWCELILTQYDLLTGYSLANTWQRENGLIPVGYRLVPKLPFVLGGEYKTNNLYLEQSVMAMKERANIALQIRDVPDGGSIQFNLVD
ncbi:hypothetical protein [Yersinia intermedia]|uniref:hypothetical protein n=1 Tax=Yersinia intermedia TaxID=631 RepID=UPI0005DD8A8F|nr:hypothetical protein [Yersinia intermedia]MCB5300606.1 hypothetical protein [Yersinia intermedia]MDN0117330.1 hypothetical protein [Yersinia intermedia]CNK48988.1 Uncharacterised protein [Yersinia intermedia]